MEILAAKFLIPITSDPIPEGAVAIEDGEIYAVGTLDEVQKKYPAAKVREFSDCALLPGLVNAHTHLDLTAFPFEYFSGDIDPAVDLPQCKTGFVDWILGVVEYRKRVVPQTLADAIVEGLDRSLRAGTTCVGEISTLEGEFALLENANMRGVIFPEVLSFDANKAQDLFEAAVSLIDKYGESSGSGARDDAAPSLLQVGISPHTPYTVSRSLLKIVSQYARESGLKLQIHVSESFQEMEFFFDAGGEMATKLFPAVGWGQMKPPCIRKTPIQYLEWIDFLKCSPILIHCVQMSDADFESIKKFKCSVVVCPRSNHFLKVGKAPLAKFLEQGIPVALGTDSLASNTSLSLWDEMRFVRRTFGESVSSQQVLHMATLGGAQVLGISRKVGSLEKGKRADLLAVRLGNSINSGAGNKGLVDYLTEHVHTPDIQLVMIDGRECTRPKMSKKTAA